MATVAPSSTIPVTKPIATVGTATVGTAVASQNTASSSSSGKTHHIKIVSASWDTSIKIWDLSTSSGQYSNTSTLTGHTRVRLIDSNYSLFV